MQLTDTAQPNHFYSCDYSIISSPERPAVPRPRLQQHLSAITQTTFDLNGRFKPRHFKIIEGSWLEILFLYFTLDFFYFGNNLLDVRCHEAGYRIKILLGVMKLYSKLTLRYCLHIMGLHYHR